jgi:hypothetical protein
VSGQEIEMVLEEMISTVSADENVMTNREKHTDGSEDIYVFDKQ